MFCPNCGLEDLPENQYCRTCGTDLVRVRDGLRRPGSRATEAMSAREEIGRAVATRIGAMEARKDLERAVETILPQVEQFLLTPEEQRLKRIREGTVTASIGFGIVFGCLILGFMIQLPWPFIVAACGMVVFMIGLAVILNGYHFSIPHAEARDRAEAASIREMLGVPSGEVAAPPTPRYLEQPPSVVEHTTRELRPDRETDPNRQAAKE